MEGTDFLKNNKARKMFFKLIKMNLLCTLLYTKMQIMQGFFWEGNTVTWPFVFIATPLKDPSKIYLSPRE